MAIAAADLRRVMGCFATGVTIVTTRQADGAPCGLTASAVTSVSLLPPLVLVCVDKESETYPYFSTSGVFAVNILTDRQQDVAARFAVSGGDKFAGVPHRIGMTGAPVLEEHLAYVECRIAHAHEGGDHTIYVGHVEAGGVAAGRPLLYFRGAYGALADSRDPSDVPKTS